MIVDVIRSDRPERPSSTPPPGQFSEQGLLAAMACPTRQSDCFAHTPLVGSQHSGDVLQSVPVPAKKSSCLCLDIAEVVPVNLDMVQNHPSDGVAKCSHGFSPCGCIEAVLLIGDDGFSQWVAHCNESPALHEFAAPHFAVATGLARNIVGVPVGSMWARTGTDV